VLESIIGAKQGDILGPVLFNFIICAVMMVWKQVWDQEGRCEFRTKGDAVLVGRNWKEGGGGGGGGGLGGPGGWPVWLEIPIYITKGPQWI
jgi:hypothetical protein